jgi:hypothetical protein
VAAHRSRGIGVTLSLKPATDDSFVLGDFKGEGEILFDIVAGRLQRASKTMETSIKFSDGQAEVQGVARSSVLMEVVGQ